jgi:DNA-binding IclR family transcriptional regulator
MTTKEQELIDELKGLEQQGLITKPELSWCLGAIRVRHGLTRATKHQLRDTVRVILDKARSRTSV